jgi:hypothetical protein
MKDVKLNQSVTVAGGRTATVVEIAPNGKHVRCAIDPSDPRVPGSGATGWYAIEELTPLTHPAKPPKR